MEGQGGKWEWGRGRKRKRGRGEEGKEDEGSIIRSEGEGVTRNGENCRGRDSERRET